ncbi:hypothetical protein AALP_AAs61660U000100 [Arabis alpina]|uniref:GLTSCR protein conserved domain-containing protein n=1 Tax=Arabis alpina TaxID=50452 RepID=A0A087FWU2_ARAAL|nr:hypothetical protein AALP_AAs61660U000100 [Arabis alpina]
MKRLLPYHVVADYEAEEDDRILLESDPTSLPRSQQWDNNIAAKVAEFTATFEKQVQAFNMISEKRRDGELRSEERLMIEQQLLQDERKACIEVKTELDREMKAQEARLRMAAMAQAGQVRTESHIEMMARNPLRANAIGNRGEQGRGNMNHDEMMMMMNGWGNSNNNNNYSVGQREEKEPLEDFLNDEENENGETGEHENWRGNVEFDLNTR